MPSKRRIYTEEQKEARRQRRRYLRREKAKENRSANKADVAPARRGELTEEERNAKLDCRERSDITGVYIDIGDMMYSCSSCKALHFLGERKKGSSARNPAFSRCCQGGSISASNIPLQKDPPPFLKSLLTGDDPRSKAFRKNIVRYNNALCLSSVHAHWVRRGEGKSSFNPTVTLQGRLHHFLGGLSCAPGKRPAFMSVYINDPDLEVQTRIRTQNVPGLEGTLVKQLTSMLMDCNSYVQTFLCLHEILNEGRTTERYKIVIHADRKPAVEHVRRYNGPSCSEVAALIPGNEDGTIGNRDIVVRRRGVLNANGNEKLHTVSVSHRSYDPLSYVLLLPDGADGWHPELSFGNGKRQRKLTCLMFYRWRLYQRPGEFNSILAGCRLFQHYLVDQFCKMESERLSYVANNQSKMRAESYSRLRELLGDSGGPNDESEAVRLGKLVVLPSTYVGGERYMRQKMHDIIATSTKLGHPDIFLTMTCNPNWVEIQRSLLPAQSPQDRPDLCARVFMLKLQALMEIVIQDKIFGKVIAHVRVVEFQKRGLPHAHCIFILDEFSKNSLRNPEKVDEIISAEIPCEEDAHLRK